MKSDFSLALSILKWGLAWALGVSLMAPLLTWALAPQMFGDGQYGMIFMVTFPIGWIIGAVIGLLQSNGELLWATIYVARHEELALAIQILLFVVSPLVGLLGFIVAISFILLMGFIGDWLDQKLHGRHASRHD